MIRGGKNEEHQSVQAVCMMESIRKWFYRPKVRIQISLKSPPPNYLHKFVKILIISLRPFHQYPLSLKFFFSNFLIYIFIIIDNLTIMKFFKKLKFHNVQGIFLSLFVNSTESNDRHVTSLRSSHLFETRNNFFIVTLKF